MKLWIIHKEEIGFSRIIAEAIQDFLYDYVEVSVGNVNKMKPYFLVEEKLDFLIIGDIIEGDVIPSPELQTWLIQFSKLCTNNELSLKSLSVFNVNSTEFNVG